MSTGRVAGTPGSRVREPLLRLQGACVGDEIFDNVAVGTGSSDSS